MNILLVQKFNLSFFLVSFQASTQHDNVSWQSGILSGRSVRTSHQYAICVRDLSGLWP